MRRSGNRFSNGFGQSVKDSDWDLLCTPVHREKNDDER